MKINTAKLELLTAQRGMNYGHLAEKADVSRQTLSTIKSRGTCAPITAHKLAQALEISVEQLVEGATV